MAAQPPRPEGFPAGHDEDSKAGLVIAIATSLGTVSTVFTAMRLYTRTRVLGNFHRDDVAIIFAQVIAIMVSVITGIETKYGLGHHVWIMDPDDSLTQIKFLCASILGYNVGLNVVKVGFLLLYLRIFSSTALRTISKWVLGYVLLWTLAQLIILAVTCIPLAVLAPGMEGKCLDTYTVWLASSIMSTVMDFVIFALPLPWVVKLRLRLKQKLITVLMFSLGFFVCVISIVRIQTLETAITAKDPTWDNVKPSSWSIVELNCAIICHDLPVFRLLLVRYFPALSMPTGHASSSDSCQSCDPSSGPPTVGTPASPTARHESSPGVSFGSDGECRDCSSEEPKVRARCFSGGWERGSEAGLVDSSNGKGWILVTTDTTIETDPAPAGRPRHQGSFSWEERTLGEEDTSGSSESRRQ